MIIEPAATATEQITGNSSRTARAAARPRFRAKRHPATPIRNLRLAPSRWFDSKNAKLLVFWQPATICPTCLKIRLDPISRHEEPRSRPGRTGPRNQARQLPPHGMIQINAVARLPKKLAHGKTAFHHQRGRDCDYCSQRGRTRLRWAATGARAMCRRSLMAVVMP